MTPSLPPLLRLNKTLLIVSIAGLFLEAIFALGKIPLRPIFGLGPLFFDGFIFQVVTFPFLSRGLFDVIFHGLVLWFFGSELEGSWGARRYFVFLVVTLLGQAIGFLGVMIFFSPSSLLVGLSGLCSSISVVYGLLYPDRLLYLYVFPVKAKWFASIIVGVNLYQALAFGRGGEAMAELAAMAAGVLWLFSLSSSGPLSGLKFPGFKRKKGHLRVVRPRDDRDPPTLH